MKKNKTQTHSKIGGIKLLIVSSLLSLTVFSQVPPNQQNALNSTGNVGVGTISPDSKLQVNGSMSVDSSLTVRDSAIFEKQTRMKDKVIVEGEAVIQGKLTAKDNLKVLGTTRIEGPLKLTNLNNAQTDDTTFLLVDANGKVKSSSFPTVLNVMFMNPQAVDILKSIVYGSLPPLDFCLTGVNGEIIFQAPYWEVGPGKMFILNSTCKPDVMLGVGVVPTAKLHIKTSVGYTTDPILIEKPTYGNQTQKLLQLDNNGWLYARSLNLSDLYTSPSTFAMLSINNVNKSAAIEIKANGNTHNYNKLIYMEYDGPNTELINVVKNNASYSTFIVNGDGSFRLQNDTRKLLQLDADGLLHARRIIVDQQTWPDYVFKKEYHLMTLPELASFIQINGHLPNVPTETNVQENGIDLGEMNKTLLQKVEELTLYVIQQQKEIEELKLKMEQIEK